MATVLIHEKTTIGSDGSISLPAHILEASGFQAGDALAVWWIPPDQIILRKLEAMQSPEAFDRAMDEFGEALRAAGYDTDEKVIELVREVKREQAQFEQSLPPDPGRSEAHRPPEKPLLEDG